MKFPHIDGFQRRDRGRGDTGGRRRRRSWICRRVPVRRPRRVLSRRFVELCSQHPRRRNAQFALSRAGDRTSNETPGVPHGAAQTYEGSLDVSTAITSLDAKVDVAALADYRLIPQLLEPNYASYEIVFGSTPEVLFNNLPQCLIQTLRRKEKEGEGVRRDKPAMNMADPGPVF